MMRVQMRRLGRIRWLAGATSDNAAPTPRGFTGSVYLAFTRGEPSGNRAVKGSDQMSELLPRVRIATVATLTVAALAIAPTGLAAAAAPDGQVKSPPAASSSAHGVQTSQGVVQSVSAKAIVLKELDGSKPIVPLDAKTRVLIDGQPARLRDVKPGFVAIATWKAGKPTRELRVFDTSSATAPGSNSVGAANGLHGAKPS